MASPVTAGPLQKAYLKAIDPPNTTVEFLINPKEYSIKRSIKWKAGKQKGVDLPEVEFEGGAPRTLDLQLFVDQYEEGKSVQTEFIDKLEKLAKVDKANEKSDKKARPPFLRFGWGSTVSFKCVMTSLNVTYTMFYPDGQPARANVTIALQEVKDKPPGQNPTSAGQPGRRSHLVLPGETLDLISYLELGNAEKWRHIAELNALDNPFAIRAGQQLIVTDPE